LNKIKNVKASEGNCIELQKLTIDDKVNVEKPTRSSDGSPCSKLGESMKSTVVMCFSQKHLLIFMMTVYQGFEFNFITAELSRAYAACILGLDSVSTGIVVFTVSNISSTYVCGLLASKYGRNLPFAIGYASALGSYLACLLLDPVTVGPLGVYSIFFAFGISLGIWVTLVNEMYGSYFPTQKDIAYNLWNVMFNVGLFIPYAISTSLCVYTKIYIQITALTVALLLYSVSYYKYRIT